MREFEKNTQQQVQEIADSVSTDPAALGKIFAKSESVQAGSFNNETRNRKGLFIGVACSLFCLTAVGSWFLFESVSTRSLTNEAALEPAPETSRTEVSAMTSTTDNVTSEEKVKDPETTVITQEDSTTTFQRETTVETSVKEKTSTTLPSKPSKTPRPETSIKTPEGQVASSIDGTWYLQGYAGGGMTVTIKYGIISAPSCPSLDGHYTASDGQVTISSACSQAAQAVAAPSLTVGAWAVKKTNGNLILSSGSRTLLLSERPGF